MMDWIRTDAQLPPDGVEVRVMDSGGHVQTLKRRGNLFWFPDSSMYVHAWKNLPAETIQRMRQRRSAGAATVNKRRWGFGT